MYTDFEKKKKTFITQPRGESWDLISYVLEKVFYTLDTI